MRVKLIAIAVALAFPLGAIAQTANPSAGASGAAGATSQNSAGASAGARGGLGATGPGGGTTGSLGSVGTTGAGSATTQPGTVSSEVQAGASSPLDKNKDGFVSRDEAKGNAALESRFGQLDKDGDGRLNAQEMSAGSRPSGSAPAGSGLGVK